MDCTITTLNFEGPLDLLLHLIKESNIDIFEIKIADITNQYLNYINKMKTLNLNIDSEYIIMAADLIELKSRELLPQQEEQEEEDPKEELINRLIEYQKYKEISQKLKQLEDNRNLYFSKEPTIIADLKDDNIKIDESITIEDLLNAFKNLQEKIKLEAPLNTVVTKKEYSVHKRNKEILEKLKRNHKLFFEDLFDFYSKDYVVITFLSILDLAKKGRLEIYQNQNLDHITIVAKEE